MSPHHGHGVRQPELVNQSDDTKLSKAIVRGAGAEKGQVRVPSRFRWANFAQTSGILEKSCASWQPESKKCRSTWTRPNLVTQPRPERSRIGKIEGRPRKVTPSPRTSNSVSNINKGVLQVTNRVTSTTIPPLDGSMLIRKDGNQTLYHSQDLKVGGSTLSHTLIAHPQKVVRPPWHPPQAQGCGCSPLRLFSPWA